MKKGFFSKYGLWLIPVLMLCFFARNVVLGSSGHLDSGMGGGIHLSSKIDEMEYRVAGFHASAGGKSYFVNFRNVPSFKEQDSYLRQMPSDERLARVMKAASGVQWCVDTATGRIQACADNPTADALPLPELEIKLMVVYQTAFSTHQRTLSLVPVNKFPK